MVQNAFKTSTNKIENRWQEIIEFFQKIIACPGLACGRIESGCGKTEITQKVIERRTLIGGYQLNCSSSDYRDYLICAWQYLQHCVLSASMGFIACSRSTQQGLFVKDNRRWH
jgi:hypothetical protein